MRVRLMCTDRAIAWGGVAPVSILPAGRPQIIPACAPPHAARPMRRCTEASEQGPMKWCNVVLILIGLAVVIWRVQHVPFPRSGDNRVLDLITFHEPACLGPDTSLGRTTIPLVGGDSYPSGRGNSMASSVTLT